MNPSFFASVVIISTTVLLASIGSSSAIKCFLCTSTVSTGGGCGQSDFSPSASGVSEQSSCTYCQKTVTNVAVVGESVARTCVSACTESAGGVGGVASSNTYCCKDKDLCNGAVKPASILPVAVALVAGVIVAGRLL